MKEKVLMDKNMFVLCIVFILIILSSAFVCANDHIKLLAVSEKGDGNITGATADLFLEIIPGEGRVFIDTFPLTKLDTQISTRFAKEIACDFIHRNKDKFKEVDCNDHDFVYTIKAKSPIIGGPSAGAAISVLTISSLTNVDIDENIAITGTINSGGFIGVVSGIKHKIDAAAEDNIKKVLIPRGTRYYTEDIDTEDNDAKKNDTEINFNNTKEIDLKEYALEKGVELIEVDDLNGVMHYFTDKEFGKIEQDLQLNEKYVKIMKRVSEDLCMRSKDLLKGLDKTIDIEDVKVLENVDNQLNKSRTAYNNKKYYSSASYCFGSNVNLNSLYLKQQDISYEDSHKYVKVLESKVKLLEKEIDSKDIKSVSDLQIYMVVKERITETKELLKKADSKDSYLYYLGFAEERYHSALSWKIFFDSNISEKTIFDKQVIKNLCNKKLEEAQERMYYLAIVIPMDLKDIQNEINYAIEDMNNEDYELCMFKSLKAKAQANSILNVMNIKEDYINKSMQTKLNIIKNNIIMENNNNMFPIIGYSYYEYADELKNTDIGAALLYSEYALELSNFHVYLNGIKDKGLFSKIVINEEYGVYIVIFLIGLAAGLLYNFNITKKSHKKRK